MEAAKAAWIRSDISLNVYSKRSRKHVFDPPRTLANCFVRFVLHPKQRRVIIQKSMGHRRVLCDVDVHTRLGKFETELDAFISEGVVLGYHDPSLGIVLQY